MDVRAWLEGLGLEEHTDSFEENGVDGELLRELTNEDLKDLGVARLADRKRLLKEIARLFPEGVPDDPKGRHANSSGGERRQVTILFADLAGFTTLSTMLDPEELHDLLNRFYETVDGIVEEYDGTVDKHLGDGVMALFGAPRAHGDDPLRAVRCAFDIHAAMASLSAEAGRPLSVHAGIASGEVVAGGLGRDGQQEYTVLGNSVNLASRLDGMADAGDTLVSDAVQRAVAAQISCTSLGEMQVKGLDEPVKVWRAVELLRTAPEAPGRKFVGRRAELRQFSSILGACEQDRVGQTVVVRGDAGMGKSTLVHEFSKMAEAGGFKTHKALVLDFGVGRGQDAISALVRGLLSVAEAGREDVQGAADVAVTSGWVKSDHRVFLNDLLDLPQSTELHALYDAMDNATRIQGKRNVLAEIIEAACAQQGRLLVVEDIHWADAQTLHYLTRVIDTAQTNPVVVVLTTRMDNDPLDTAWRGSLRGIPLVTLDIGPLREDEATALASSFMNLSHRVAQRCLERAGGNPLFLEQLMRNARESEGDSIPASIQSLVLARLDRLPTPDKEALQAASVLGQRFSPDTLRHLIDNPSFTCENLCNQMLIRSDGESFLFNHALIQEGVYSSLLKSRRRVLHQRAATWFSDRDPMLRAEHLDRAEDPAAPSAYLEAAKVQAGNYRYEDAIWLIERGLTLATEPADRFTLTCQKGQVLHDQGAIDPSSRAFATALEIAEDDVERCRAWLGLVAGLRVVDRYEEALSLLEKAQAVADRNGLVREQAEIHHLRGNLFFPMGRIDDCAKEHEKSLAYAKESGSAEAEANALSGLADANYVAGRMASAFRYFDRCVEVARRDGFGRIEVANRSMVGFCRLYLNQLDAALEDGLKTVAAAKKAGHQRAEMLGDTLAALVLFERAEHRRARPHIERALALSRQLGAPRFEAQALLFAGVMKGAGGDRDGAIAVLQEARAISAEVGHGFCGARIAGELARNLDDELAKRAALSQGETMLAAGAVAHNHFYFYPAAIDVALGLRDWEEAERYAGMLEDFTRDEPLPWSDFFIRRGRALVAWNRGRHPNKVRKELVRLREEAEQVGLLMALPALDDALNSG